ncbi:hypothetical protein NUW58_g6148 [Xylaria curta]|uniref:Uncharacterized protein n=1 Tax=Xylaria curta TaxID=42375 RepID=A0ACC1P050_9PEZI|nr:hypothetical protein NUW58_g6148 [Xylaria curta]
MNPPTRIFPSSESTMPKRIDVCEDEELVALEDETESLTLHSKQARHAHGEGVEGAKESQGGLRNFLGELPYELFMKVLTFLRPSDLFRFQRTSRNNHAFVKREESRISQAVLNLRYSFLKECFLLPVLVTTLDSSVRDVLLSPERYEYTRTDKQIYQHVKRPEPTETCTCLTCVHRWYALSILVDFAHWQEHLDKPYCGLPWVPGGGFRTWNDDMLDDHAAVVRKALYSPLWYACLMETHLTSTTRSIRRQAVKKGNGRREFEMTEDDVNSGTDDFLNRAGPSSLNLPASREFYYELAYFLPTRYWGWRLSRWLYIPATQHDQDIGLILREVALRRKDQLAQQTKDEASEQA